MANADALAARLNELVHGVNVSGSDLRLAGLTEAEIELCIKNNQVTAQWLMRVKSMAQVKTVLLI